jgi:predicted nucleic acid-binding protein
MNNQSMEADFSSYHVGNDQAEPNAEQILEGSVSKDQSLEQVREILFGAEKRRSEHERRALDQKLRERIETLEADYERRFEKLAQELQQRFEKSCALLEAETAARREALLVQHEDLIAQLSTTAKLLGQAKTDRDELAGLLEGVAERLRTAAVA